MKKYICIGVLMISSLSQAAFQLTSPAFSNNGDIPARYTCDGENISPELSWSGVPENTKSFALIVDDPDAPAKVWVHWVVCNIPSKVTQLGENASVGAFIAGSTDFNGARVYGGPCPPSGVHRYQFTLYALDAMLDIAQGVTKEALLAAMQGHVVAQAVLIGRYQRAKN